MVTAAMELNTLASWEENYGQPRQHIKSRDITLLTKVHIVKAIVFPVVMYGYESWTKKKANAEDLMLLNCDVGQNYYESLGQQGYPTSPS